jgi:anti-anti-sigma factor
VNSAFNIEIVNRDDGLLVRVEGELDVATAPVLDEALKRAEESGAGLIVVDLTGVSFIDSTGLRALLEANARDGQNAGGDRLRITGGSEQAQKLFKLAGVLDKLPFVASADE